MVISADNAGAVVDASVVMVYIIDTPVDSNDLRRLVLAVMLLILMLLLLTDNTLATESVKYV